jgi:hypothetical protein
MIAMVSEFNFDENFSHFSLIILKSLNNVPNDYSLKLKDRQTIALPLNAFSL